MTPVIASERQSGNSKRLGAEMLSRRYFSLTFSKRVLTGKS
jgi:hypothetical protein